MNLYIPGVILFSSFLSYGAILYPPTNNLCANYGKAAQCSKGTSLHFAPNEACNCLSAKDFEKPVTCMKTFRPCSRKQEKFILLHQWQEKDGLLKAAFSGCGCFSVN